MMAHRIWRFALVFLVLGPAVLLSGCRSTALNMAFVSTPDLNSCENDANGTAVRVFLYELSDDSNFRSVEMATFFTEGALGNDVIDRREYRLFPDRREPIEVIKPNDNTRFIGVAADMRCPDGDNWRRVYSVEELKGRDRIVIEVTRDAVAVN